MFIVVPVAGLHLSDLLLAERVCLEVNPLSAAWFYLSVDTRKGFNHL